MNDIYTENTQYGSIKISENAVHKIVETTLAKYKGKLYLTNSKGKRMSRVYKSVRGNQASDVQVTVENGKVTICTYLIIKFGMSIKETTEQLAEELREAYKDALGVDPWKIKIVITGVMSKKLAKRNVEVEKIYE